MSITAERLSFYENDAVLYAVKGEKQMQDDFMRLLKMYNGVIVKKINEYSFIQMRELREDIYQDILLNAWRAYVRKTEDGGFRKGDDGEVHYGGWFGAVARTTITSYTRRGSTKALDLIKFTENPMVFEVSEDEVYGEKEDNIASLSVSINALAEEDQAIIRMWMEGINMKAESERMGFDYKYLANKFSNILKKLRTNAVRYFENIHVRGEDLIARRRPDLENKGRTRPVNQLDPEGNIVTIWPSLRELGRHGWVVPNLQYALRKEGHIYRGFQWEYADAVKIENNRITITEIFQKENQL